MVPECANELWYKAAISYLLLAWTGVTLLFALAVASFRIREIRLSSIAQTIVTKMLVVAKNDAESTLNLQVLVTEAAAQPGAGEEESWKGGSTGSSLVRPRSVHSYEALMGERFQSSLNKVGLHYLLEGSRLLQWAKAIHLLPPNSREQAIEDFQTVNQLLFDLPWDVTHYGVGCMAQAMRHLCQLHRIEDFVTHCAPEERQGMAVFMHAYADFIANDESDAKISEQGLLLPDGKPVIVATLMTATHAQHKMMVRLMENICVSSAINKGQSSGLWRLPSAGAHLTRPRKSSIWNTATPVVRAVTRFAADGVPKIETNIEEEEPGGAHGAHRGASADSDDCIRRKSSNGGRGRRVSPCRCDGIGRRPPSRAKSSGANDTDIVRAMSYSAPDDEACCTGALAQAQAGGAKSSEELEVCQPRRAGSTSLAEGGGELAAYPPHLRQRGIEIEATASLTPLVLSAQAQPWQLSRHHADADADSKAKYSPSNAMPTLTADGASEHERGPSRDDSLVRGHDSHADTGSDGTDTADAQCGTGSSGCCVDSEHNLPGVSRGASAGVTHLRSRSAAGKEVAPSP